MAHREQNNHWNDHTSIREKAKNSVRNFLAPTKAQAEDARPLNPDLVARVTEPAAKAVGRDVGSNDVEFQDEDNHEERMVRSTERERINRAPNTIYPG
ncbi:MAG: hypothetical protein EOP11_02920 [Proteobacteria bacterium]|nr:MAG: hypothetical protein EOP11_02920 [Pseudomonadota bacterium]